MRHFITFRGIDNGNDIRLDVSAICNSTNTSVTDARCTKDFKSSSNVASFTIGYTPDKVLDPYDGTVIDRQTLYENAIQYILTCVETKAEMQVEILDDTRTRTVFTGLIDPTDVNISRNWIPQSITISCRDYTTDLDREIGLNIVYNNKSVNEIVNAFLAEVYGNGDHPFIGDGTSHTGTYDAISALPDSKTVEYFVVTDGDSNTFRKVIDTLLFECPGYVLHYDHAANRFEIVKSIPDEVDDSAIRTIAYKTEEGIQARTGVYKYDGILLKWPTVEVEEQSNVYSEDIEIRYDGTDTLGKILAYGDYYPADGDITATRQEFRRGDYDYATGVSRLQNKDISLLYATDAQLGIIANPVSMRDRGTVADLDALAALSDPRIGDYAKVTDVDGEGTTEYRAYDGEKWIYTRQPSVSGGKGNVYTDKGEVSTYASLPSSHAEGDFYRCLDTGITWCWMDNEWQRKISLFCFPVLHTPSVDMTDGNPAFYPRSMWALGRNRSGGMVNLLSLSVTATSVSRVKENKTTHPEILKEPEEYTSAYIYDQENAESFALWLYNAHRIACTTVTWYEWEDQRVPLSVLGERVKVEFMPGRTAVFCVVQIDNEAVTRLKRKYKITALLVSGFQSAFSGKHTASTISAQQTRNVLFTEEYFASSSSSTVTPSAWSSQRVIEQGKYLWTKTITHYSDGSVETTYSTVYNAKDGEDADLNGYTYEVEYGLSDSPTEFHFPNAVYGYDDSNETGVFGYEEGDEYGFEDIAEWSPTFSAWYKGLYVWQRIKTTDANGNTTYGDPTYCEELTRSLINGCILEVIPEDPTWEKNLAAAPDVTVTVRFNVVARSYGSIAQFEQALANGDGVTITPYQNNNPLDPITVPAPVTKTRDPVTNLVVFTYAVTFARSLNADGMTILANISDTYITPGTNPEQTYSVTTESKGDLSAVDITVIDPFGGLFPGSKDAVSTIAEADALAEAYFSAQYEGTMDGATYSLNISGDNFLALRTYTPGGWVFLTNTGYDSPRISAICAKAQKAVLTQVESGTVTATDYGYFNVVIANIVTAAFIGSKQIQLQEDEQGNPGMIYGGQVDLTQPQGQKTTGKGFYFDSDGNGEVSNFKVKGNSVIEGESTVKGKIVNTNDDDGEVVFETFKDNAYGYTMEAVSKIDGITTPDRFSYAEWRAKISTFCDALTAGTLYAASGTITAWGYPRTQRKTLAYVKRLTSVSSTVQTLVDEASQPTTGATDVSRVVWKNEMGKTIRLESLVIEPQFSRNLFGNYDYGDTHVIVYESDGTTVYQDYGNNDDSGASYSGVSVPPGGKVWCFWGRSTRYSYTNPPGHITITYKESDNWSVGVNFCFDNGSSKLLTETLIANGYGYEDQEFTCNGTSYVITFSAAATWPSGVYKYYGNFAWAEGPEDSQGNPPAGTITASLLEAGSFTYAGQTKTIVSITFSTSSLSILAGDGITYNLSTGYDRAYTFSAETLAEVLGARSRSILPVYDSNGVRIGGGYVGTNEEPWYQGWAEAWQQTSKRSRKEDIEEYLGDAVALLNSVKVVKFHYKSDRNNPDRYWHYGFIADDTDEAMATPQHNTMDLGNCIGILIRGVQLLAKELQKLKGGNT